MRDAPAFWLRPAWLNDSRDNPRDPEFEPFWMRDPAKPPTLPRGGGGGGGAYNVYVYGTARMADAMVYVEKRVKVKT